MDRTLTIAQVAGLLQLHVDTLQQMIDDGLFPDGVPISPGGREKRWTDEDIRQWMAFLPRLRRPATAPPEPRRKAPKDGEQ